MDIRFQTYALDHGLNNIDYQKTESIDRLPIDSSGLLPPDINTSAHLQQLLDYPTLNDLSERALAPELSDQNLLAPQRFKQALGSAADALTSVAEKNPDITRFANRALRVINEEISLRNELATNQGLLLQG